MEWFWIQFIKSISKANLNSIVVDVNSITVKIKLQVIQLSIKTSAPPADKTWKLRQNLLVQLQTSPDLIIWGQTLILKSAIWAARSEERKIKFRIYHWQESVSPAVDMKGDADLNNPAQGDVLWDEAWYLSWCLANFSFQTFWSIPLWGQQQRNAGWNLKSRSSDAFYLSSWFTLVTVHLNRNLHQGSNSSYWG